MTVPLFLVPAERLVGLRPGAAVVLDGAEGRHAATVRRLRPGEPVDLTDGNGRVGRGRVAAVGAGRLEVEVFAVESIPPPDVVLVLAQALAKGGRDELAVQVATEIGVDVVVPWQASRCVVRWSGERGERSRERWTTTTREAAKQSRRLRTPTVSAAVDTPALAARVASSALALLLDPAAAEPLTAAALPSSGELLVVVGPEGGIADDELTALAAAGARPVRLGPEVLRASTAGPVALALLAARLGRWS